MFTLKRLKQSRAARNAATSYFAFFSIAFSAFLSIPIAVSYLDREEIGLWAVVTQVVTYLLWMDLGIGGATGRKMADAIAASDHPEINRWWTATRMALFVQGALVALIGFTLMPYLLVLFEIPAYLMGDAKALLVGCVTIAAFSFPLKGIPGLMMAQERFHWIPLVQGLAPWVGLGIFAYLLHHGYGVRSYLWGTGISMAATWVAFSALVRTSPQIPRWDSSGLNKERFKSLFGFSINLGGIALITSVMNSIPALLISRAGGVGGLAMVPPYNFTSKGPVMISNLVQRLTNAFYPRLQRLYVEGKRAEFARKYIQTSKLSLAMSTVAAGVVIGGARFLVEVLSGPEFYGGGYMTAWLGLGVVCIPLAAMLQNLRQIAGNMGKTLLFSALKLLIGIAAAIPSYHRFGLAGLTAVFMLIPLIDTGYGYARAAASCGFSNKELLHPVGLHALFAFLLAGVAGFLAAAYSEPGILIQLRGKPIHLPGAYEAICGTGLVFLGSVAVIFQLKALGSRTA